MCACSLSDLARSAMCVLVPFIVATAVPPITVRLVLTFCAEYYEFSVYFFCTNYNQPGPHRRGYTKHCCFFSSFSLAFSAPPSSCGTARKKHPRPPGNFVSVCFICCERSPRLQVVTLTNAPDRSCPCCHCSFAPQCILNEYHAKTVVRVIAPPC